MVRAADKNRSFRPKLALFCLMAAFAGMLICSRSSPLYPTNDWVDVNCFFTVGRAVRSGWVPYRDLCEQKGPILYFIYALAAWISDTSFIGAFLMDVLAMAAFLYFSACTIVLFTGESKLVCAAVILLSALIHSCEAFASGGSAEGLCLWTLAMSMYFVARMFRQRRCMTARESLAVGAAAGFVLCIKFNLCAYFAGLALAALIVQLIRRCTKGLGTMILCFFAGIALVVLPVMLYFAANHAVGDFFKGYFYNNLFLYGDTEKHQLMNIVGRILRTAGENPVIFAMIAAGGLWMLLRRKPAWDLLLAAALSYGLLVFGVFWSNRFPYYGLIFTPAAVFGLTGLCALLRRMVKMRPGRMAMPVLALWTAACIAGSCFASGNTGMIGMKREDMPQYRFAEIIRQTENPSLLNYGFLDGGFYLAANVLPPTKYFCILQANIPEMHAEQKRLIREGEVDYVVCEDKMIDSPHYALADAAQYRSEGVLRTYYLYKRQ